jgi:amidase
MANSMDGQNSVLSVVGPLATNAASLKLITQAFLAQKPWLYDPMVHEIPWRSEKEEDVKNTKLCFAVMKSDGVVNPMPPISRALDILVSTLQKAGHSVITWTPPSHRTIIETGFSSWMYDGGADVRSAFALSGEPMSEQVSMYKTASKEFTGSQIAATNVALRKLKKEYLDYWNSTSEHTGTGRPVDAVVCPLAPFPAARPGKYGYYGYSTWVNVLDYTSVVVPVTNVDKNVDKRVEGYEALDEQDQEVQNDCKCTVIL